MRSDSNYGVIVAAQTCRDMRKVHQITVRECVEQRYCARIQKEARKAYMDRLSRRKCTIKTAARSSAYG